ncbi:glycoside hydrolase family 3 C-terminal domain-containing protein [Actinoplanes sp. KI2]|uniref:glycoside hydrolase family 3 protein n=1 Tax=Actinoplanes sp. KI2 TaxID=2983315 RepID=UPI0021D5D46F|nr:glycoside hydrolase family 3 C-terminal domain-containing protein [Actinoplanes sp. KI2]MCU7728781.1 glycoside hydrolase family 3 C-terminal domain-containing protein [Actinoplanes sp. KI2]
MIEIADVIKQLSLEEKVSLLAGQDFWSLPAIERIGLRSLVMSDGPIGVRGTGWAPDDPSIALPSPTALAAAWDPELAETAGRLLGQEARRKGVHVVLGPTVNLQRTPLGGRHFECYSEDPLLSGEIAVGFVRGVQAHGVGTTVKHLVGNDFETDRMEVDVRIDERTLREIYLAPFERVVEAGGWGVMSAYNGVNGSPMAANGRLQDEILKGEWGFDGVVVSDWRAARSTVGAALGGLDIAMPQLENPWGGALVEAVRAGEVPEAVIDEKVRRVLRLAVRVGAFADLPEIAENLDGDRVAHEVAARSFVLARNENYTLPLEAAGLTRVAVIGALAMDARVLGGGSAQVSPPHTISPLEGLARALSGVDVEYAVGADPRPFLPALHAPTRVTIGSHSFTVDPAAVRWIGSLPGGLDPAQVDGLRLETTYVPDESGPHTFAVSGFGSFRLAVDGDLQYEGALHPANTGRAELLLLPREQRVTVELTAGVPARIVLDQFIAPGAAHSVATTLGHRPPRPDEDGMIEEAARVAAESDVAVVVVGTTEQVESEGFDRTSLALPGRQDELVSRVAAANPRTIVVVNAGSPVLMPWSSEVAAILLTWFPGQEGGAALADVLLGVTEPGGRLPTTWPRAEADCPVFSISPRDGVVAYDEGVFVGYRGWLRSGKPPLYAFGHGLGYTTWSYDEMVVDATEAMVTVSNVGARFGREVIQVYVSPTAPDPSRPQRWLAGFANVEAHPGETVTVRIPLPPRTFQTWNEGWKTVPGDYTIHAAHAVDDLRLSATLPI